MNSADGGGDSEVETTIQDGVTGAGVARVS